MPMRVTGQWSVEVGPGTVELQGFALQAEPVSTMTVSAAEQAPRGLTLPVEVRFKAGGVSPKERLIRVDVVDPNGKSVPHYRDFIVLDAEAGRFALPLAFNDAPGKWIICATDVISGVRAEQVVSVR